MRKETTIVGVRSTYGYMYDIGYKENRKWKAKQCKNFFVKKDGDSDSDKAT
jgi:hypothetical protein